MHALHDELNKQTEDNERRANVNNDSIPLENIQQNLQCNRQREELIQAHLNNPYQLLKRKATGSKYFLQDQAKSRRHANVEVNSN